MAIAGYAVTLKVSGDAVAMTAEATTDVYSDGTTFQITAPLKRVLDPDTQPDVFVDGEPIAFAGGIDYLFGVLYFLTPLTEGSVVTVTGAYLPLLSVGEARSASLNLSRAELDTSVNGTAYTLMVTGQKSGEGSLGTLRLTEDTVDVAEDLETWDVLHDNATPKLLEVGLGTRLWRGWVRFPGLQAEAPHDGVVSTTVNFKTVTRNAAGRSEVVSYGFGE